MIYDAFHKAFCDLLSDKIPNRKELVAYISRELHLDKRAVYRRLEGEHQFRINEVLQLCPLLDISLDKIALKKESDYQPPRILYFPFGKMTKKEYATINYWLDRYKSAVNETESYIMLSCNILPDIFCFQHDYLARFYRLKWAYYMGDPSDRYRMDDEPAMHPAHLSVIKDYIQTVFRFPKLIIIWDYNIIPSIIEDIEYFTQIGYLTLEHRARLREELLLIINQIDDLCKELTTPEDAGNFTFAVSSTYLPKNHTVFKGADFKVSIDSAFYTTFLYVSDSRIVDSVEHIILTTLKSSVIISQSNENERLHFVASQKALIDKI